MKKVLPKIKESISKLKRMMKRENNTKVKIRIQALYLIKRQLVKTKKGLAEMFGLHRKTIGEWLKIYEDKGILELLTIHTHTNRKRSIRGSILRKLKSELKKPKGFKGYKHVQKWIKDKFGVDIPYKTVHKTVYYYLKSKLKVPRKSNINKDPKAQQEFIEGGFIKELKSVNTKNSSGQVIKVFAQDETRLGLMTIMRRVITAKGIKPIGDYQHLFDNYYLYGVVEPTTGDNFYLELPELNSDCFQVFLNEFSKTYSNTLNILMLDRGQFHRAHKLIVPDNIKLIFQPAHSPELNPIERLWEHIKNQIASEIFENLMQLKNRVADIIKELSYQCVKSLTGFDYFVNAVNATFH